MGLEAGMNHRTTRTTLTRCIAVALMALPAHAQTAIPEPQVDSLPPLEYDRPYSGTLTIERGDKDFMEKNCPKSPLFVIPVACAYFPNGPSVPQCHIIIANDDILKQMQRPYNLVLRHEVGHCNGWPKDHVGARPADITTYLLFFFVTINGKVTKTINFAFHFPSEEVCERGIDATKVEIRKQLNLPPNAQIKYLCLPYAGTGP
jgi:hypothetical protein